MKPKIILLLFALALCGPCVRTASHRRPIRSIKAPLETVHNYEVVRPTATYEHSNGMAYPKELRVFIPVTAVSPTVNYSLIMKLNEHLISPDFKIRFYDENGNQQVTKGHVNCFYQGTVESHSDWTATMSTCHGLQATFGDYADKEQLYHLEPLDKNDPTWEQAHALYLETEYSLVKQGECGSNHSRDSILSLPGVEELGKNGRLRRQQNSAPDFYYVEWLLVSDNRQFQAFGSSISSTVQRSITVANEVNIQFQSLGISPPVIVTLTETVVFNTGDRFSIVNDPETLLQNFRTFMNAQNSDYDSAMLLTGSNLIDNKVGYAYIAAMCSDTSSMGLTQDGGTSLPFVRLTAAHELGHILNMRHDDARKPSCTCTDPSGHCVMTVLVELPLPTVWSSCSRSDILTGIGNNGPITNYGERCLRNVPAGVIGNGPVCGNGLVEGSEQCDCGTVQFCTNPCCNAATCQFVAGAKCAQGSCCSQQCRFVAYGTTCRQASSSGCDITEYCPGYSDVCPPDQHLQTGTPCAGNTGYCYDGQCPTRDAQCQVAWGSVSGNAVCFDGNTFGDIYGHCGHTSTAFIPCATQNAQCGQLQCTNGTFDNIFFIDVRLLTFFVIDTTTLETIDNCRSFTTEPGADQMSPGLVADGTRCGDGMLCQMQVCRSLSSLGVTACPSAGGQVCGGNGLCNDDDQCSCNVGFTGSACQTSTNGPGTMVNECLNNNGGCDQICMDTDVSFSCSCNSGFVLASNGRTCSATPCDSNECQQVCTNSGNSFVCSCLTGYDLASNGLTCSDIDECSTNNGGCQHNCGNTLGSFECSCNTGSDLVGNGQDCIDTNECASSNGGCETTCTNTQGSFTCSCDNGFTLAANRLDCNDINECSTSNGGCQHNCNNTLGSFECSCNTGFDLAGNRQDCIDINECNSNNGGCEENCSNSNGSFSCSCPTGFSLASNQRDCNDINECSTNNGGCQHNCNNTLGSFECSCNAGSDLAGNGQDCIEMDECATNNGGCQHTCTNDPPGSFTCSCDQGFQLNQDSMACDPASLCASAGHVGCCLSPGVCFVGGGDCWCDRVCYSFRDCCEDILDIGCLPYVG